MAIAHGRHERRGAEGAEGGGVRGEGILLPGGEGSGDSPENFCNSSFQMVQFGIGIFTFERCVKHRHMTVIRTMSPPYLVLKKAYTVSKWHFDL